MFEKAQSDLNRRTVLKGIGTSVVGTSAMSLASTPVSAQSCDDDSACEWEDTAVDSDYTDYSTRRYKIQHGYCLTYYGSYKDNQDRIHHDLRVDNTSVSRYKPDYEDQWYETNHVESFGGHYIWVDANYASNILLTGNDSTILGAMPPSDNQDHSGINATMSAIEGALGMINPGMALALTARQVADDLMDDRGSDTEDENYKKHEWSYGNDGQPHEISNHWEFFIMMENNCDNTTFDIGQQTYNYEAGSTYIEKTYTIENTDCGNLSSESTEWSLVPEAEINSSPRLKSIAEGSPLWYSRLPITVKSEEIGVGE